MVNYDALSELPIDAAPSGKSLFNEVIYHTLRALGFRSLYDRLREDRLLRARTESSRVVLEYLGPKPLPRRYVIDVYRTAEYWGLRASDTGQRQPTPRERQKRRSALKQSRLSGDQANRLDSWPVYMLHMPLVYERTEQTNPVAFDLLARRVGSSVDLTLPELDELTRTAVLASLSPAEANNLARSLM
jgi:hypothetical protein